MTGTGTAVAVIGRQALAAVGDYHQAAEVVAMLERHLPLVPRLTAGCEFTDYALAGRLDDAAARQALDALEPLLAPAPVAEVVAELVRLRLVTKARAEDAAVTDAAISVMAEDLAAWPMDVVRAVCRSWGRNGRFWPSLAELNLECDWRARRRLRMAQALRRTDRPAFTPTPRRMEDAAR